MEILRGDWLYCILIGMAERLNFTFSFTCRDCRASFTIVKPNASNDVLQAPSGVRTRVVMLTVPNECPECHNIRLVRKA